MRSTRALLRQVLVQPLAFQGDPTKEAEGVRRSGKTRQGGQYGTKSAPLTGRPLLYDGPTDLPYWHHVADIWRPKLPDTASVVGHETHLPSLEGGFELTPALIAARPILRNIVQYRNDSTGPPNALARWESVKTGYAAGIFDKQCLHRAGYFVLDVLAEHRDFDAAVHVYDEMHKTGSEFELPFDAGHAEKMLWACYSSEQHEQAFRYFVDADKAHASGLLKTSAWACVAACLGRSLEAAKGIDVWDRWVLLGRPVSSYPPSFLAELAMGCLDDAEVERVRKVLRNFNDLYLERVWGYCRESGMENDAMVYYVEWLFKSRRHVMLDPHSNISMLRYALNKV